MIYKGLSKQTKKTMQFRKFATARVVSTAGDGGRCPEISITNFNNYLVYLDYQDNKSQTTHCRQFGCMDGAWTAWTGFPGDDHSATLT